MLTGMPDTDFSRKYPPDPWGEETSSNARVWKVYRDEMTNADNSLLGSYNKTLDVLLIFVSITTRSVHTFADVTP